VCQFGQGVICNDNNPCTNDFCSPSTGCAYSPYSCDDSNACTDDACLGHDACQHTTHDCNDGDSCTTDSCDPVLGCQHGCTGCVPGEIVHIGLGANKSTLTWDHAGGGSTSVHDVARGRCGQFPVGTGAAESCFAAGISGTTVSDFTIPATGAALWYDVRGRHACGSGPWGMQSNGVPRTTPVCP
jgi:hypothetical protein